MIEVVCCIAIYEINGKDCDPIQDKLIIKSHWNRDDRICLMVDGKELTVIANDLVAAIHNTVNTNRF